MVCWGYNIFSMDLLKPGQRISLFFPKEENLVEMSCSITNVKDDRIVIELPPYFMRYIEFLDVGARLTAKAFSKVGTVDFNTVVISSPLEEEFSVELDYNAMRFTASEDMPSIKAIEILNIKSGESSTVAKTIEITAESLKFYSETEFVQDAICSCELILPEDYGIINFTAIVTDVDPVYENEYTITYSMMTEDNRQTLLYYMYVYNTDGN